MKSFITTKKSRQGKRNTAGKNNHHSTKKGRTNDPQINMMSKNGVGILKILFPLSVFVLLGMIPYSGYLNIPGIDQEHLTFTDGSHKLLLSAIPIPTHPSLTFLTEQQQHPTKGPTPHAMVPYVTPVYVTIPINNKSGYVASDVSQILHVPSESRIEVHLQNRTTRRCQNPHFIGRISGWSLSMLQFQQLENNATNVIIGTYDRSLIPVTGTYSVEILVMLCEHYNPDSVHTTYLKTVCLEDVTDSASTLTHANASIDIVVMDDGQSVASRGQWLHQDFLANEIEMKQAINTELLALLPPKPVHTRYQPEYCFYDNKNKKDYYYDKNKKSCHDEQPVGNHSNLCQNETIHEKTCNAQPAAGNQSNRCHYTTSDYCSTRIDRTHFEAYTFRWNEATEEAILNKPGIGQPGNSSQTPNRIQQDTTKICLIGASHSRYLRDYSNQLARQSPSNIYNFKTVTLFYTRVPGEVTTDFVKHRVGGSQCTHVVVGLYQWYFTGGKRRSRLILSQYKADMTRAVKLLEAAARDTASPLRKVILRSVHDNPFKKDVIGCPARDFRTPSNTKAVNSLLQEIVNSFAPSTANNTTHIHDGTNTPTRMPPPQIVSFIDTGFILDPVWDSSSDWNHYKGTEGLIETKFILSEILKEDLLYHNNIV